MYNARNCFLVVDVDPFSFTSAPLPACPFVNWGASPGLTRVRTPGWVAKDNFGSTNGAAVAVADAFNLVCVCVCVCRDRTVNFIHIDVLLYIAIRTFLQT